MLPVKLFAADMQMLRDAGYHTVTPEQITAWREGVLDLPHNALLLTFDDGRTDTVLNAAPILQPRRHARHRVRHRRRLEALAALRGVARGAALAAAPGLVDRGPRLRARTAASTTGDGERLPYLSARRIVRRPARDAGRSSAPARPPSTATRARPREKIANRPVVAFAWPFGAYGADTRTNDARVAAINLDEARRVYSLGFNEDGQTTFGLLTKETDPMRIARFEIVPTLTPRQLFERLELAIAASAPEVSRAG